MVKLPDLSIDELVELAKTAAPQSDKAQSEIRPMKDLELFVATIGLVHGRKSIHNLIIFDLYLDWQKSTEFPVLSKREFLIGMSYFFRKVLDKQRNVCFKISPIVKVGQLKTTPKHLESLRVKHGKKENETVPDEVPSAQQ
jgi:hypothetical protein